LRQRVEVALCIPNTQRVEPLYWKTIHELRITNYDPAMERPLFIPIILGTARRGRQSENVARFVLEQTSKRADIETELIDVCKLPMKLDDAGEQMKDPTFSATIQRCDGLIIVTPEYNHGYPGLLKHALDMNLEEYVHKAVGICGVSAGTFGGARVIEGLLPVMRELGLVTIFWDVNFGNVQKLFDEQGNLLDQSYVRRVDKFLNELIWMARVLRYGRANIPEVKTE
jgi:NAD(P)H-dependent FMN reductase